MRTLNTRTQMSCATERTMLPHIFHAASTFHMSLGGVPPSTTKQELRVITSGYEDETQWRNLTTSHLLSTSCARNTRSERVYPVGRGSVRPSVRSTYGSTQNVLRKSAKICVKFVELPPGSPSKNSTFCRQMDLRRKLRDFRLPRQNRRKLRSSGSLRSKWW